MSKFNVNKHEEFLGSFTKLFKQQDTDLNGIISEKQFYRLIEEMSIGVKQI